MYPVFGGSCMLPVEHRGSGIPSPRLSTQSGKSRYFSIPGFHARAHCFLVQPRAPPCSARTRSNISAAVDLLGALRLMPGRVSSHAVRAATRNASRRRAAKLAALSPGHLTPYHSRPISTVLQLLRRRARIRRGSAQVRNLRPLRPAQGRMTNSSRRVRFCRVPLRKCRNSNVRSRRNNWR
jgi:hypothetical protein